MTNIFNFWKKTENQTKPSISQNESNEDVCMETQLLELVENYVSQSDSEIKYSLTKDNKGYHFKFCSLKLENANVGISCSMLTKPINQITSIQKEKSNWPYTYNFWLESGERSLRISIKKPENIEKMFIIIKKISTFFDLSFVSEIDIVKPDRGTNKPQQTETNKYSKQELNFDDKQKILNQTIENDFFTIFPKIPKDELSEKISIHCLSKIDQNLFQECAFNILMTQINKHKKIHSEWMYILKKFPKVDYLDPFVHCTYMEQISLYLNILLSDFTRNNSILDFYNQQKNTEYTKFHETLKEKFWDESDFQEQRDFELLLTKISIIQDDLVPLLKKKDKNKDNIVSIAKSLTELLNQNEINTLASLLSDTKTKD